MFKAKFLFIILLVTSVVLISWGDIQQSAEQLYQSGIYKEEVEGELEKAVEIYEKILEDFPQNKATAAKALYHIGLCYEKLGNKEAQKAYQRLVKEYPGQIQEVNLAKERLASLVKAAETVPYKPTFRKIRIPFALSEWSGGHLSPDGITFAFASENQIWVVPIQGKVHPDIAGEPIKLKGASNAWGYGLGWSGDGRWIAYNSELEIAGAFIYVISSSGGVIKKIPGEKSRGGNLRSYRVSLSPNGTTVAFNLKEKEECQIFAASVESEDIRQITKDGGLDPCYSPDGSMIAYVTPSINQENNVPKSDVWVIPVHGGDPVKVSDLPGAASGPLWSPDGKMIAFLRTEEWTSYRKEICIVPVSEEAKPLAPPVQIEIPFETNGTFDLLAGWTPDNKIGILLNNPAIGAIYTVPATGGKAMQATPSGAIHPQWSPNGKSIYFRWQGGSLGFVSSQGGDVILDQRVRGGRNSDLLMSLPGAGNSVSPDGKTIVFSGARRVTEGDKLHHEVDIYTIPVNGGEPERITNIERPNQARYPCWSPDGKWIAHMSGELKDDKTFVRTIYKTAVEGGEASKITSESDKVERAYFDWSPDGKSIAYFSTEKTINVIPIGGGQPRVICKVQDVSGHSDLSWSPDGEKIAFVSRGKIWVVSAEGSEPVEVKTDVDASATKLDWSPDGEKIAFTGWSGGDKEFWFMEDFLPLVKGRK